MRYWLRSPVIAAIVPWRHSCRHYLRPFSSTSSRLSARATPPVCLGVCRCDRRGRYEPIVDSFWSRPRQRLRDVQRRLGRPPVITKPPFRRWRVSTPQWTRPTISIKLLSKQLLSPPGPASPPSRPRSTRLRPQPTKPGMPWRQPTIAPSGTLEQPTSSQHKQPGTHTSRPPLARSQWS